jgi:hypothetical protein
VHVKEKAESDSSTSGEDPGQQDNQLLETAYCLTQTLLRYAFNGKLPPCPHVPEGPDQNFISHATSVYFLIGLFSASQRQHQCAAGLLFIGAYPAEERIRKDHCSNGVSIHLSE